MLNSGNMALENLKEAELNLKKELDKNATRAGAIALTHIQTAILWLEKSLKPTL